ncbi:MAG: mechanosensitive ion channel family protein [Pseudanabaenaceae cyanobacterium]|jgi:MscS family membrane protein
MQEIINSLSHILGNPFLIVTSSIVITVLGTLIIYFTSFYSLRSIFRTLDNDFALVTLNISTYPALVVFALSNLTYTLNFLPDFVGKLTLISVLKASIIVAVSYWINCLFVHVIIYYLKDYTQRTEALWDDVLLPLLEAVVPVFIYGVGFVFVLTSFNIDLTGFWVALGGATFVVGLAAQGILANFFSGVVLLIDTPFQFGDVLLLDNNTVAVLRKIGVRVTKLYIPEKHCDIYIPNSNLQSKDIVNLSRPTSYYHYTLEISLPITCEINHVKSICHDIILAHPDTLGDIDAKLAILDRYYQHQSLAKQQKIALNRLQAEIEVNQKLEEVSALLEALAVTLQFAERGGINQEEVENVQLEYTSILQVMGFEPVAENRGKRTIFSLVEQRNPESLLELLRGWYRLCLRDPNLLDNDSYLISEEWERKISLLKKRAQKLYGQIMDHQRNETRLDDYVLGLQNWLQKRFKESREKWQDPQVLIKNIETNENITIKFSLNFFVDDVRLENGMRGTRVNSQIYQEVVSHLKQVIPTWQEESAK